MRLASAHEMKPSIGALVAHMRGMFGLRREDAFGEMVGHPAGARGIQTGSAIGACFKGGKSADAY